MTKALTPPAWMADGLCGTVDPELWFPSHEHQTTHIAKALCHTCPVVAQCLEFALADTTLEGIWAGTTPRERSRLRGPRPAVTRIVTATPKPQGATGRLSKPQTEHGTARGLATHRRLGSKPCKACIEAGEVAA